MNNEVEYLNQHAINEGYLELRTAIFDQERTDWHGRCNCGNINKRDIIPSKEEILEFINSDWFETLVNSSMPIEKVRRLHIESLGTFRKPKNRTLIIA